MNTQHERLASLDAFRGCLMLGSSCEALLMPINKSLWTPSYATWMTGWALLAFASFSAQTRRKLPARKAEPLSAKSALGLAPGEE